MDLGKAFSYVFDDEEWIQVILIGGLILIGGILIPVVGWIAISFLVIGFTMEIARNVAMGSPRPLPRFNSLSGLLDMIVKGFYGWLVQLIYMLPVALLGLIFACVAVVIALGAGNDEEAVLAGILPLMFCLTPLMIVLSLVLQPISLAAWARYLQTGSLGAALRFGEVFAIVRANLGTWVVLWLLMILCGLIVSFTSFLVITIPFAVIYSQAVFGHLLGQVITQMERSASPYSL